MAANDELPRGLALQTNATNAACTIVYPATPGISWVLTAINGKWICNNAFAAAAVFSVTVNGVLFDFDGGQATIEPGQTGAVSWSGSLAFPVGAAVTIVFPPPPQQAVDFEFDLSTNAYPI